MDCTPKKVYYKEAAMSSPSFTLFEKKMDAPWYTSSGYDVMVKCVPKLFFLLFYLNKNPYN